MKKIIIGVCLMLLTINLTAQKLPYASIYNESLQLTLKDGVLTLKNLTGYNVTVLMANTKEDTVWLKSGCSKVVTQKGNTKFVGAKDLSGCKCWLQLVTDCSLLPVVVTNFKARQVLGAIIQVDYDAMNVGAKTESQKLIRYSFDGGETFKYIVLDVSDVTGVSQHFSKIITLQ